MNVKALLLILFIPLLLHACNEDSGTGDPLTGCCGTPAIDAQVGNGHIYLPNIITPNADGINDRLWPSSDYLIIEVIRMQVRDSQGHLVFEALNEVPNNYSAGWDGRVNGVVEIGVYNIVVEIEAENGTIGTLEGKVCNYPCRDSSEDKPIQTSGCQFPIQVEDGHYNPNIPSSESNECFE